MGYEPIVDKANNIFITKPAHKNYKHLPTILLQGHSDMVGTKDSSSKHDFLKDPIQIQIKDG
jgi:dipeptidase D